MAALSIEYIADAAIDAALDRELREILATCFTKPGGEVFRERRYWHELPQHRWLIRAEAGAIIAHVAVHERVVLYDDRAHQIGGIAEVCVHPEHRGHGHVKTLLASARDWLRAGGFEFAILFGDPLVYSSSGCAVANNLFRDIPDETGKIQRQQAVGAMVLALGNEKWPATDVVLPGQIF